MTLEIACVALGLSADKRGVGSLVDERARLELSAILAGWGDSPITPALLEFASAYRELPSQTQSRHQGGQSSSAEKLNAALAR